MNNQIDHVVEHFFHKKNLNDVSVYELERFIATHPYFPAGHFLLAKKSQQEELPDMHERVSSAALYYHNPLWLQWLLEQNFDSREYHRDVTVNPLPNEDSTQEIEETEIEEKQVEVDEVQAVEQEEEVQTTADEQSLLQHPNTLDHHVEPPVESYPEEPLLQQSISNDMASVDHETDEIVEPIAQIEADTLTESRLDVEDLAGHEMIEHAPARPDASQDLIEETIEAPQATGIPVFEETRISNEGKEETAQEEVEEEPVPTESDTPLPDLNIEKQWNTGTLIPAKGEVEKNELAFEPYHTIDYFASQGIKLQQADLSRDKFGKQLKSFTDWLRSMKRLPQPAIDGQIDEATQQSIQRIAEHSFDEKDVVTETMAEVWIKQGNKEKALETLQKLSLLNPSKSHYFAAKIDQLNAS